MSNPDPGSAEGVAKAPKGPKKTAKATEAPKGPKKTGEFKAIGNAFYKNERVVDGDTFTITDEKDWRSWMVPIEQIVAKPKPPFPESMMK